MDEQVTRWQAQAAAVLDVRPDLERGDEPFARIMEAAAAIHPGESLLLIAPFEPVPLYGVLGGRGFQHETRQIDPGAWAVRFIARQEAA